MSVLITAKSAGLCFGTLRAIKLAEHAAAEHGSAVCVGELIHNTDEMRRLEKLGIDVVETAEDVPAGAAAVIRSHGVPPETYETLQKKGANIYDGTCPKVAYMQRIARKEYEAGREVFILGDPKHPEIRGICGFCPNARVFDSAEELLDYAENDKFAAERPVSLLLQSTQTQKNLQICKNLLKNIYTNGKIFDTICRVSCVRQEEAKRLAESCDAMLVIGGKHSANSRHLAELCRESCMRVQFIENASELDAGFFDGCEKIGLTAGASVPAWIIKEVEQKMCEEVKTTPVEGGESFDELLENSIKTIYNGDTVKGTVAVITPTEITVDLGTKHSGYIPVEEFTENTNEDIHNLIHVGDTIEACVVHVSDIEGTVKLSKRRLDAVKSWAEISAAAENGDIVEGEVTEENKGGVVVIVKGVRVFVPASQSGLPRNAELGQLVGQTVRLKITECTRNRGRDRIVGSIRVVANKERRERIEKLWAEMEVGKHYEGTVKSLTSYGAFVDIGGIDGMVHVSELSWKRIRRPADVVSVGDVIDVYVISFDRENRRISLGYKDPNANPWDQFMATYQVGSVANVKIVKLMTYGAFAEVMPGVDGLIHISQIANRRIANPEEVLTVGEQVDARITAIDEEKHKISLSIRALSEPERAPEQEHEDVDAAPAEAEVEPAPAQSEEDALVFEVSETGEVKGNIPEGEPEAE